MGNNFLREIPGKQISDFEHALCTHVDETHPDIIQSIRDTGDLTQETQAALDAVLRDFAAQYLSAQ